MLTMASSSSVILLAALCSILLIQEVSLQDTTVGELPAGVQEQFLGLLYGTLQFNGTCPLGRLYNISFLLYSRSNPDNPIYLDSNNLIQIDPSKKVILLVHGYLSSATAYGFPELKNAYLRRYDCNLIILDWSQLAVDLYTTCYCEVPNIGRLGAQFLCDLHQQLSISLSTIHVVGHSLGAHLSGYIGTYTTAICGEKIGRITGLDPAGPLYEGAPPTDRLDESDATFVDVMHTNALKFGYWKNIGHVDFHVNCGKYQPKCPYFNASDVLNTLVSVVCCSHLSSLDYMEESVNSDQFIGESCSKCPQQCLPDALSPTFAIMGDGCSPNLLNRVYWIPTTNSSLYALGCTPYPFGCS